MVGLEYGSEAYMWVKVLHVISIVTWMAGLFYLPRLFVYHAMTEPGTQQSETFKIMERRLLNGIMWPSLVIVVLSGAPMLTVWSTDGWMHVKLTMVGLLIVCHLLYSRWRQDFLHDRNRRSDKFYRVWNEVPTIALLIIVVMVIIKPF